MMMKKTLFLLLLTLGAFHVSAQQINVSTISIENLVGTQNFVSIDTAKADLIKRLGVKACYLYYDSILHWEKHYDKNGREVLCKRSDNYVDSTFYPSRKEKLEKHYHDGVLQSHYTLYSSKRKQVSRYFQHVNPPKETTLIRYSELRFKRGRKVYHESKKEKGKTDYLMRAKYRFGRRIWQEEIHYDYRKDSLVNITHYIIDRKGSRHTHTNEKYTSHHYSYANADTLPYDYLLHQEEDITYYENKREILEATFDEAGNIIHSWNYAYMDNNVVRVIHRHFDIVEKRYEEAIRYYHYNEKGLYVGSGDGKWFYKYEYY